MQIPWIAGNQKDSLISMEYLQAILIYFLDPTTMFY
jgi:hypothetical protein